MTDLASLYGGIQSAQLLVWPETFFVRSVANLEMQVADAVRALDHNAYRVDLVFKDGTRLEHDEIRQLHLRFIAEKRR